MHLIRIFSKSLVPLFSKLLCYLLGFCLFTRTSHLLGCWRASHQVFSYSFSLLDDVCRWSPDLFYRAYWLWGQNLQLLWLLGHCIRSPLRLSQFSFLVASPDCKVVFLLVLHTRSDNVLLFSAYIKLRCVFWQCHRIILHHLDGFAGKRYWITQFQWDFSR